MTIIELILAPTQIIIKGPRATFGREFKIVRYGSKTLAKKSLDQNKEAIKNPNPKDKRELINISSRVIKTWFKKLLEFIRDTIVFKIELGEENKKLFIILNLLNN